MASFLRPVPDTNPILPGGCFLVLWRPWITRDTSNICDYWPAVVCPVSMLPKQVAKSKPGNAASNSQAVWLIGESTFLWVDRSRIYSLHETQRTEHAQRTRCSEKHLGADFATYFKVAKEYHGNLDYWRSYIREHQKAVDEIDTALTSKGKKRVHEGDFDESIISEDRNSDAEASEDSHLKDSDGEGPARKKMRPTVTRRFYGNTQAVSRSLTAPSPPPSTNDLSTTPTASTSVPSTTLAASSRGVFIKQEQNDYHGIPDGDLVEVFVGPTNTRFECSRNCVTQSAVLTGRITERDGTGHHPFIMDPTFSDIDPAEFEAVVQFLHDREYEPFLVQQSDGRFCLEESQAPINYDKDLLRSGNLFNLAKRFQLPAFGNLVLRKVLHGHRKYDARVFLSFASTVLGDQQMEFRDEDEIKGVLEDWVTRFLAENMATICSGVRRDAADFWKLMQVKGVELRVMETKVEMCKKYPGGRVKIED